MAAKRQDERLKVNDPSLELLQLRDSLTADVATALAGNTVVQGVIFGSMDARAMALLVQVLRVNSTIEASSLEKLISVVMTSPYFVRRSPHLTVKSIIWH